MVHNPNARLREPQVRDIYNAYKNKGIAAEELANTYKVSVSTIYRIVWGSTWKWLGFIPVTKKHRKYVWENDRIRMKEVK